MMCASVSQKGWSVVTLVFLFMLINYADKSVVGLSSVPMMQELGLSHRQFGLLGSAFFLLFAIAGVAVGFLANRLSTTVIMTVMALVWAAALLLPIAGSVTFTGLLISRIVLGAAEGPAFPLAMHAVYKWFGNQQRELPSSVVASGAAFGTGIVAPLISWIILHHGWRASFIALGMASLLWAGLWRLLAVEGPLDAASGAATDQPRWIPYRRLLTSRTALGVYLGGFGAYWVIALNIVWLANYLNKALHMSPARAAWVIALPSALQLVFAPGSAYLSRWLARRGVSSRLSRGLLGALCVSVSGLSMLCLPFSGSGAIEVLLVGLSFSIGSVIFTLGSPLIGEISPSAQRGAVLAVTNSLQTLAGLVAPLVMGLLVDINANPTAGFRAGFLLAGGLVAALGVLSAALIHPESDALRLGRWAPGHASKLEESPVS